MKNYFNIIDVYHYSLNKIASELNSDVVTAVSHKILKKYPSLSFDDLHQLTNKIITVATLEDFYDSLNDPNEDMELVNILGASLASQVNELMHEGYLKVSTAKGKYDHINFKPPPGVAGAATRGLELRRKAPKSHKGGLDPQEAKKQGIGSGVARAVSLKNRSKLSPSTISMMVRFFARHNKNIEKAKKLKGKDKAQSKAYQAALLWGGDAGRSWANKIFKQMKAADKKSKGKK